MASYTYSHPIAKNPNYPYYVHGRDTFTFNSKSSDTSRRVLKYRIEHMAKLDLDIILFKKFSIGVSGNYLSAMKNVDKMFFDYDCENPAHTETRNKNIERDGASF